MIKNAVLNNLLGSPYVFANPILKPQEEISILATLFEQLMIFDSLTLTTSRLNFALTFLISKIGINNVERMLDGGYLKFILWSPIIVTSTGTKKEDGSIDESSIYGQVPIVAGELGPTDLDPEKNISVALSNFNLHKDRKRSFTKKALKHYTIPDGMLLSTNAAKLVIDAYKSNNLEYLGLPFLKEPEHMNLEERGRLLDLSNTVTETAVLSRYGLKSYENYESYEICRKNLENIGKGYNISANTSSLFNLENVPDLKTLFISQRLDFDDVFKLRHLPEAKNYRKWINEVGENGNMYEVSKEYINSVKGNNKFFETTKGKLLKNLGYSGVGIALAAAITGPAGIAAGVGLNLLETFLLDNILKGKNPSMFISKIGQEISPPAKLND